LRTYQDDARLKACQMRSQQAPAPETRSGQWAAT
jgi:hypothetical protein